MGCPSRMIGIIEYADGISMEDQGDWRCRCPWIRMTGDADEMSMEDQDDLRMPMGCPSWSIRMTGYADGISMEDQDDWRCRWDIHGGSG